MNTPIIFSFEELPVRILPDENNEPWFCAKDVCAVLGYQNDTDTIKKHCIEKGVAKRYSLTKGGEQALTFINEGNLYRLIIKSRKPEAQLFESWVCDEVLPTIRKTGSYAPHNQVKKLDNIRLIRQLTLDLTKTKCPFARHTLLELLKQSSATAGITLPDESLLGPVDMPESVPSLVADFWEAVEFIGLDKLNHSRDPCLIAINLPHLARLAADERLKLPTTMEFRRVLMRSETPRFLEQNKTVNSRLYGRSVKCWVFAGELAEQ